MQLLWKTVWQFLKKLAVELPEIMFLDMYIPKRIESRASKRYLHTHVHSIIRYSQKVKASQVYIEG